MRKVIVYFLVYLLILSLFPYPIFAETNYDSRGNSIEVVLLGEELGEEIELYGSKDDVYKKKSKILIPDNTKVELLPVEEGIEREEIEEFLFIRYIKYSNKQKSQIYEGYVHGKYIFTLEEAKAYLEDRTQEQKEISSEEDMSETTQHKDIEMVGGNESESSNISIEQEESKEQEVIPKSQTARVLTERKPNQKTLTGLASKQTVSVYESTNYESEILKDYKQGHVLKYRTYSESWYEASVKVEGEWKTGYIQHSDVENTVEKQEILYGISLLAPTNVFASGSTSSKVLRTYDAGTVLKYKTFTSNWYEATVKVNGKWQTGYIRSSHVEEPVAKQDTLKGIGLKSPTYVYSKASTNSKRLRSYSQGTILKYKTFTKDWYEATVKVNGKWQTGYIHSSHVEEPVVDQETLQGVGIKNPTRVYERASISSKALKSYTYASILKYREFTSNWYEATVYVGGKRKNGYIHKQDVGSMNQALTGYAQKNPTVVYGSMSRSSNELKSYPIGSKLKYRAYNKDWHKATVYIEGKATEGYIHAKDVGATGPVINGYAYKKPTTVYQSRSKSSKALKSYAKGSNMKYRYYNNNWFQANVIIDGKRQTGYIHKNDVGIQKPTLISYANKSSTRVYAKTSRNSSILKSYQKGSKLKYKPYNKNWYEATVYIKGKPQTGFIHKNDLSNTKPKLRNVDKLTSVNNNNQLILVTSKGYNTSRVSIQTFERDSTGDWKRKLSTSGHIGKNGFARNKVEGDGKSPVGKYTIGTAFGQRGNPGTRLPFRSITNDDVWVDDPKSKLYNTWQSRSKTKNQWKSAENMNHRLYRYGFVINYNTQRTPYKGSAIFFHVANNYTLGCTGTSQANVISILKWLDPKKKPVIIQTPEQDLNKY